MDLCPRFSLCIICELNWVKHFLENVQLFDISLFIIGREFLKFSCRTNVFSSTKVDEGQRACDSPVWLLLQSRNSKF
jgi:hypothetical protein